MRPRLALLLLLAALGCDQTAVEAGRARFNDPHGFADVSPLNKESCASCHSVSATEDPARLHAGYNLYGVAARERYWGGNSLRLLDAVDACLIYFMRGRALDPESDEAKQLYEYLLSITPDDAPSATLPMTIVERIDPIDLPGDPLYGEVLYDRACKSCHGAIGALEGPTSDFGLPADTCEYDTLFPTTARGLVVIEKIRHGRFFAVGGYMPFYTLEVLSDQDIADILAALDLSDTEVIPCP